MKLYDFTRLINKYSTTFLLCQKTEGKYVYGKWEDGQVIETEMTGAIVPMSERKIYSSGGTFTTQDRELYLTCPLTGLLSDFSVKYKGNKYSVEESRDYEEYADVAIYTLRRVSAPHD